MMSRLIRSLTDHVPFIGIVATAVIASASIAVIPLSMQPAAAASPAPPTAARAIATKAGTEVRFRQPSNMSVKPTGYQVTSCGPFQFPSDSLTAARTSNCANVGKAAKVTAVDAASFVVTAPCAPAAKTACVLALRSVAGKTLSTAVPLISGGAAPGAPTGVTATPLSDGKSVSLTWAIGSQPKQPDGSTYTPTFEVYRAGTLLADNMTAATLTDSACGLGARCSYTVAAVTSGGRAQSAAVSAVTLGTAAPTLAAPKATAIAPGSKLTGQVGHGASDARDVTVTFARDGADGGAPTVVQGSRSQADFTVVVPNVAPGFYIVSAAQAGRQSKTFRIGIAPLTPVTVKVPAASGTPVPALAGFIAQVSGTGLASPVGKAVSVENRVLAASVKVPKAPTAAEMQSLFAAAPKGQQASVAANAAGAWNTSFDVFANRDRIFVVSASQVAADGKTQTAFAIYRTPKSAAPASPRNILVTAASSTLVISWTPPVNDGGSDITGYKVTTSPASAGCTTSTTGCTIANLANGTAYTVSVVAINAVGSSIAASGGPAMPVGLPSAPTHVLARATSGQAVITWQAPDSDGGSAITGYTVTASPGGMTCTTKATDTQPTRCVFTSLSDGTAYTFSVVAANMGGASPAATASATPKGAPTPPAILSAAAGDASITVTWQASASNGGSTITGYTVTATPGGRTCSSVGLTCTVTGLINGTAYSLSVTAANALGTSPASSPVTATPVASTKPTIPSAPRNVVAVARSGALAVSWMQPANIGGGVTRYTATASPGGQTCTTSTTACDITGLDDYAIYKVSVVAVNSAGTSTAGQSGKRSYCALEPYGDRCYLRASQYGAPNNVLAVQVDGGIEISFDDIGAGPFSSVGYYLVTAAPSGETCMAYPPNNGWGGGWGSDNRTKCIISTAVSAAETFRVQTYSWQGPPSPPSVPVSILPPPSVSLDIPRYTNAATLTLTGNVESVNTFFVYALPSSCDSLYTCRDSIYAAGAIYDDGTASVSLPGLSEGTWTILTGWTARNNDYFVNTTGTSVTIDRTAPSAAVFSGGNISEYSLRGTLAYESGLTVTLDYFVAANTSADPTGSVACSVDEDGAFSCDISNIPQGAMKFVVTVADSAGNTAVTEANVLLDTSAPDLEVSTPVDSAAAGIVRAAGSGSSSPGDSSAVIIVARSGISTMNTTGVLVNGRFNATLNLGPGIWTITFTRTDVSGNRTVVTRVVTVDPPAAGVMLTLPSNNSTVPGSSAVLGTATAGATVAISVDGTQVASTVAGADGAWRAKVAMSPGPHTLTATAGSESASVQVVAGGTSALSIAAMGPGGRTAGTRVCGTAAANAAVALSWGNTTRVATADADSVWCVKVDTLADGDYTFTADNGAAQVSRQISIDRTAPEIRLTTPSGAWTNTRRVAFDAPTSIGDAAFATVQVFYGSSADDEPAVRMTAPVTEDAGAVTLPPMINEGTWTLVITRTDASGNRGRLVQTVTLDTTAPELTSNLAAEMSGPLTISGHIGTDDGDLSATLTIDGTAYPIAADDAGNWRVATNLRAGTHTVVLRQADRAGNTTSTVIDVVVDSIPPDLSWELVNGGAQAGLTISGSARGADGAVNILAVPERSGVPALTYEASPSAGTFSVTLGSDLPDDALGGWWNLTATRADAAGNTSTLTARVFIDPRKTALSLDGTAAVSSSRTVTIAGSAEQVPWLADSVAISVTRGGSVVLSATAAIHKGGFSLDATLGDGVYDVTVTRASALNAVTASISIQVDTQSPAITITSVAGTPNRICGSTARALGDADTVTITLTQGSSSRNYTVDVVAGKFCLQPPTSGRWSAVVSQTDAAGNTGSTASATRTYDVDPPEPTMAETSPPALPDWWRPWYENPQDNYIYGKPQWHGFLRGTAGTNDGDASTVAIHLTKDACAHDCQTTLVANVGDDGGWQISLDSVAEGTWYVDWVEQADDSGNSGRTLSRDVAADRYWLIVDHTAPIAPQLDSGGIKACPPAKGKHVFAVVVKAYIGARLVTTAALDPTWWCLRDPYAFYPFKDGWYADDLNNSKLLPNGRYTLVAEMSDETGAVARSATLTEVVAQRPSQIIISGMVTDLSQDPSPSAALSSHPVLKGTATVDGVADDHMLLEVRFASGGSFFYAQNIPINDDGTWSWQVPDNFRVGSFYAYITQNGPGYSGNQVNYDFSITSSAPTFDTVVMQKRFTLDNGLQYNTIILVGTLPEGRAPSYGRVRITSPWVADTLVDCSSLRVAGNQWSCEFYGPTAQPGYGPNSGYTDRDYTFEISLTYDVVTDYWQWNSRTYYRGGGSQVITASTTVSLKASVPEPTINSPAKAPLYKPLRVVNGPFTITGAASTGPNDRRYVTAEVYPGNKVANSPTVTADIPAADGGSFTKDFTLADGTWTIRVCQSDTFGLTGCSDSVSLVIDNTAPSLAFAWPSAPGARIPSGYAGGTLTGGYGDGTGWLAQYNGDFSAATVRFFRGTDTTADPVATSRVTASEYTRNGWGAAQDLAAGQWTVQVSAADLAGNIAVITRSFIVDPAATAAMTPSFAVADTYNNRLYDGATVLAGDTQLRISSDSSVAGRATPPPTGAFTLLADGVVWTTGYFDATGSSGITLANIARRANAYELTIKYDGDALYAPGTFRVTSVIATGGTPTIRVSAYSQRGAGRSTFFSVSAGYDRPGRGWTTCTTGQASVYDSDGTLLIQASMATLVSGRAVGSIAQGSRTVTVRIAGDQQCADGQATGTIDLGATQIGSATAAASFTPAPYVGNALPVTITVAGGDWFTGDRYSTTVGWLGVPVWLLDDQGKKVGAPVYTTPGNTAVFAWTPTRAGNIPLMFLAGGAGTGFNETRANITVPVEASQLAMRWSFNPGTTNPGQQVQSTLTVGGAGNLGQVKVSSTLAPDVKATVSISCSTSCTATTDLPDALLDSGTGDITATFTSSATGRTFAAAATVPRTPWQVASTISSTSNSTVTRDTVVPVTARLTFPAGMPSRLRTGRAIVFSTPGAGCLPEVYTPDPTGYCSNTRFEVSVDVRTGNTTLTRSVGGRTATSSAQWEGNTLVITSELFVGGTTFNLSAAYLPSDGAVASASYAAPITRQGVGGAPITVQIASALITGGLLSPPFMERSKRAPQEIKTYSGWGVRNPRVGETVFVKAQFDSALTTPADRDNYVALAYSSPGANPDFVDQYGIMSTVIPERINRSWRMSGWDDWLATYPDSSGMPSCSDCVVWAVTNLESRERHASGGLPPGDRIMGVIAYKGMWWLEDSGSATEMSHRTGITGFHITVDPAPGRQRTSVALKGDKLTVDTAARWSGLAAETQTAAGSVTVMVRLNATDGTTTDLVECFYAGFCLGKTPAETNYNETSIVPLNGQVSMTITLTEAQKTALANGGTISVMTTAPWGETLGSDPITPKEQSLAASGPASVSVSGAWLGATLEKPDLTSPFGILGWGFYENTKRFWESLFGAGKAADFFITLTGILAQMAFDYLMGGGPMGPFAMIGKIVPEVIGLAKAAFTAATKLAASSWRRVVGAYRMARGLEPVAKQVITAATKIPKPQSAIVRLASEYGGTVITYVQRGCKVGTAIYSSTVPLQMQKDDELFGMSNCVGEAYKAAAAAIKDNPDLTAMQRYQTIVNARIAELNAQNSTPVTNVGYGSGVAIQFTQAFSSLTRLSIPGLSTMSASDKLKGKVTIDAYSDPDGGGKFLGTLAWCTFDGACTAMEGISANMSADSILMAGVFPKSISWTPSGAWLRVRVNMPDSTAFEGTGDIPFAGTRYDCWRIWQDTGRKDDLAAKCHDIDSAEKFSGAFWDGRASNRWDYRLSWPKNFDPQYDMPADSKMLTSALP